MDLELGVALIRRGVVFLIPRLALYLEVYIGALVAVELCSLTVQRDDVSDAGGGKCQARCLRLAGSEALVRRFDPVRDGVRTGRETPAQSVLRSSGVNQARTLGCTSNPVESLCSNFEPTITKSLSGTIGSLLQLGSRYASGSRPSSPAAAPMPVPKTSS